VVKTFFILFYFRTSCSANVNVCMVFTYYYYYSNIVLEFAKNKLWKFNLTLMTYMMPYY